MLAANYFQASTYELGGLGAGWTWYIGLFAVLANILVVAAGTLLAAALGWRPTGGGIREEEFTEDLSERLTRDTSRLELEPDAGRARA